LVIIHYHLRAGGVRRVIEVATPHLVRAFVPQIEEVTLAAGEAVDPVWQTQFLEKMAAVKVGFFVDPALGYFSEQNRTLARRRQAVQQALQRLFDSATAKDTVVWAHNLGLGRNLLVTAELVSACERRGIRLGVHHHDWWFDNRWARWPEIQAAGFRTLAAAASVVFPAAKQVRHFTINQADARVLRSHLGKRVTWLPNLTERPPKPAATCIRAARLWLQKELGEGEAPVWLSPARLLRRKNVAEALLLVRWLRPEAWLVTTGGVSSAAEECYARKLETAARRQGWKLRLGVLAQGEKGKPSVAELVAASECIMLTSLQEGFGLPYLEAGAAERPLLARALPNIAPDLHRFGFRFWQSYEELLVAPELFDWSAEIGRQRQLFNHWLQSLPSACRPLVEQPALLASTDSIRPVPFSRLTLTAQLEVLSQPTHDSWERCRPLNPFLEPWRKRAASGNLRVSSWPAGAHGWLSGWAYARRWISALTTRSGSPPNAAAAAAAQKDFMSERLCARYLYPMLWAEET
jgi:hypothetical protein